MTAVKLTKIIGILCIAFVFCSMIIPGTYTILIGILLLLPLSLYDRYLMKKDEEITKKHLEKYSASCAFMGICYEGYQNLYEKDKCEIMFKRKEILIYSFDESDKLIRKFEISKDKIKDVRLMDLSEIKDISQTDMYETIGKIGKYFYKNIGDSKIVRKNRKDSKIKYLFIRFIDKDNMINLISVYANSEFQDFNRRATINYSIDKFCKEYY